ncbi:ABC transporter permease [Candidatus Pantoea floridensis]|uniref:Iron(III) transport system permease protein n=1 Tax=Candidatus Pantoea floridensis TaxID=1938870 RepID=A0A286BUB9_9GAMM|nr:ABC transporter permease subunit [Pantoea floridensis]PIF13646.1 iron(III) transport system permease protein [Enterobacteriaceae bacterium JKS000233]SOD37745.1 iron(III) transport system permease protein [Pantoea floridensis]
MSRALNGLILLALLLLVALPLLFIVLQALFPHFSAGSWRDAFSTLPTLLNDPQLLSMGLGTLKIGGGVALCSLLLGLPLGAVRGLFRLPGAALWDLLFLIPFLTPPYIAALSWTLALQRNGYIEQLTGINFASLLFSSSGMVLVMTLNIFPVVYFAVSRSLMASGQRLAWVARVHGASAWRGFWHITLPLTLPALAGGVLLAFTLAIEEYGVPAALGAQAKLTLMTVGIETKLADWPIDLPGAALLSLMLSVVALAAWLLQRKLTGSSDVTAVSGKPVTQELTHAGRWQIVLLLPFVLTLLLTVVLPLGAMALSGLLNTLSGGLQLNNLTLRHFGALFSQQGDALAAFSTSIGLALGAALLTGALGFLIAWRVSEGKTRLLAMMDGLALLPAAMPGVVVGVGLILLWNRGFWPVSPYNTLGILLLSYSCLLLPWPVRYVSSALRQLAPTLEPAARVHGASRLQALRLIVLPLVAPSLLAAMMMVFAVASRELVTSLLLAPAGTQTVAIFIWRQFEQGSVGQGMAMATLTLLASLSLMLAATALMQRQRR